MKGDYNQPYKEQLMQIMGSFAERLVKYEKELVVDGVKVFEENDPFLLGKVAMGLAYWVTEYPAGSVITKRRCQQFRQIMNSIGERRVESWGIHFYLKALQMLNEADLITECFSFRELLELKKRLDWREFVDEKSYKLKNKPNNFYAIAYSIAFTRYQLGWDSASHSQNLLDVELEHYLEKSGGFGFADETNGQGRYDRYSFLLIAEIAWRFQEAGLPLTSQMKKWLKASAEYVLFNANRNGDGFQWGRSIGAYGDSAFLEILTAAQSHDLLNPQDQDLACYFAKKITGKFLGFWYQKNRSSINIWSDGRSTDKYRGKHRVLGENLSLLHQHLYCQRVWNRYDNYVRDDYLESVYKKWLLNHRRLLMTSFCDDGCGYSVFDFRNYEDRFTLPLVNGERYYDQMVYQPVPFSKGWINPIPDSRVPYCRPIIEFNTGAQYIPFPCFSNVEVREGVGFSEISFQCDGFTKLSNGLPENSLSGICNTSHRFKPGIVTSIDRIHFVGEGVVLKILYKFPLGKTIIEDDAGKVRFLSVDGALKEFHFFVDEAVDMFPGAIEMTESSVENGCFMFRCYTIYLSGQSTITAKWTLSNLEL